MMILPKEVIITRSDGASDRMVTKRITSSGCEPSTPIRSFITEESSVTVWLPDGVSPGFSAAEAVSEQAQTMRIIETIKDTIKRMKIRLLSYMVFLTADT
jgi:hypothetical protein